MTTQIDDDHFDYDGGQRQCISGFGENTKGAALDLVNDGFNGEKYRTLLWHIDELVRWCRGLNRELKEVKAKYDTLHRITVLIPGKTIFEAKERAGLGTVIKPMREEECRTCEGTGTEIDEHDIDHPCSSCDGSGIVESDYFDDDVI